MNENEYANLVNSEYKKNVNTEPGNIDFHAEVLRAKWVLWYNKDVEPSIALSKYGVLRNVILHLTGEIPEHQRREKRKDKYAKISQWVHENHLVQITPNDLAEIGEVSYQTALKYINDNPHMFYRIKRGLYEARNPEIARQEDMATN